MPLIQLSRMRVLARSGRTRNTLHHCFARFAEPGVALADTGRKKKAVAKGVVAQGLHPVRGGWIPWVPGASPVRVLHRQWLGLSSVPCYPHKADPCRSFCLLERTRWGLLSGPQLQEEMIAWPYHMHEYNAKYTPGMF